MQATIFGETHKIIFDDKYTDNFLTKEAFMFENMLSQNVYYSKDIVVNDTAINYLNLINENLEDEALKNIILKEYYECEKIYPYLGDYLLFKLFKKSVSLKSSIKFSKKDQSTFLNNISSSSVKSLALWIFNNMSLRRNICIETYHGNEIIVEKLNNFVFKCAYDFDFIKDIVGEKIVNYNLIVINGMIETVGEIHHLLYKANKTKEPYVIFCYGVSGEVKNTIMKNNKMKRFRVYPVSLDANNENTLNILNDFAVIQGCDVVSSDLGQTISQEASKDLKKGKEITFFSDKLLIAPCVSKDALNSHREFLKTRIENAVTKKDVKLDPLQSRLKSFTSERLNIYIPELMTKNKKILRELDYVLKFMSNLKYSQRKVEFDNQKFYIPDDRIKIANEKLDSLKRKLNDIKVIVV